MKQSFGKIAIMVVCLAPLLSTPVSAMHIAEGFLPIGWCIGWGAVFSPFFLYSLSSIRKKCADNTRMKILLAMAGAFCFAVSALKLPSVTGSSSHPTGTGLGVILFGPSVMPVIGVLVLLFQAVLLAHGGVSTLGANAFSMAVVGPFAGYGAYLLFKRCKAPDWLSVFFCAFTADIITYIVTSGQLAGAFFSAASPFWETLARFLTIFAVTQLPLAVAEGILTVMVYKAIRSLCADEIQPLAANV